jgi:hypothetical protein
MTRTQGRAKKLPQFIHDLIGSCPKAGDGVNLHVFRTARVLHPFRTPEEIAEILRAMTEGCGRVISEMEIWRAIERSKRFAWKPGQKNSVRPSRPRTPVNAEKRQEIINEGHKLVDLWEESPIRFEDGESHADEIVDAIFPGNPLLCCGKSNAEFATRCRDKWRGRLADLQLIVPNPMTAQTGLTQDGKESEHALSNTGGRRFLVVEFDSGTVDDHANLFIHLIGRAPMVLGVHSGGKSLHGWFFCAGQPEASWRQFMDYAESLGADPATWTRSQFVRMPDGLRDNGKRQTVFWFNPNLIK